MILTEANLIRKVSQIQRTITTSEAWYRGYNPGLCEWRDILDCHGTQDIHHALQDNATAFQQKFDNQGPTVTVLYNKQDSVYGGYGSLSWNKANAFLFQLKYSGSDKHKFQIKNSTYGMYGHSTCGPTFGGGNDLYTFSGNFIVLDTPSTTKILLLTK
ncbi:hypothetical protein DPMN_118895 [Dreissena polymorpha]|uniref:TLDc domain-containing protein n=1 Tax=Dreissena polymorpha TaxID=45954 RepID=A0A9D4GI99_DREPO|nr:hypothetical protein DPMN_118895 [Dreissena polymorpha]